MIASNTVPKNIVLIGYSTISPNFFEQCTTCITHILRFTPTTVDLKVLASLSIKLHKARHTVYGGPASTFSDVRTLDLQWITLNILVFCYDK